jgi:site-specific DNA-methyltransferase (adenine-specific)
MDPVGYVVSANLERRHLDESQRAMVGARIIPLYAKLAKERQGARNDLVANLPRSEPVKAREQAAAAVKVSPRSVQSAITVQRDGAPELQRAVDAGRIPVSVAVKLSAEPKAVQRKAVLSVESGAVPAARVIREVQHEAAKLELSSAAIAAASMPESDRYRVIVGDVCAALDIADASIDVIITDPPYPKEFLHVYGELGRLAARVLKPGASCVVMIGQSYLPEIVAALSEHLSYHWTLAYLTPGGQASQRFERKVNAAWKPLLWFTNGPLASKRWVGDVCRSDVNDNDKTLHGWGQSESGMADIVERMSQPSDLVLDPFCGAGTTGVVALALKRRFVGVDIDEAQVLVTRGRLSKACAA